MHAPDPAPTEEADQALADALAEYEERRAAGEAVRPQEYARTLGDQYVEFVGLLDTEEALQRALREPEASPLPRAFGPYVLRRELGRGGVGVVYEAEERNLRRLVALKILRTGIDTDETARRRIRQEARLAAQVRHESVVSIFGVGEHEGQVYIAMDLVPGEPLAQALRRGERPEPRALAAALAQVADALHVLHEKGVFHRDVKPANLIVRPDGRHVLTDFGLARSVDGTRLTQSGHAIGTPLYMSPEHIRQPAAVDARSDVYGLGAVLYEALAGRPPFQSTDQAAVYNLILRERPTRPGALAPDVPADLERVALKALEKDPAHRYQTAAEMGADLARFAAGERTLGRPRGFLARLATGARRRALPLAAGLLLALGGAWMWTHRDATLEVEGSPDEELEVVVDGRVLGRAPLTVAVAPGERAIEVRRLKDAERWEPLRRVRRLKPGETFALDGGRVYPRERPTAADLAEIGRRLGMAAPRGVGEEPGPTRAAGMELLPGLVLAPIGAVRGEDLVEWMVEVDPADHDTPLALEVWRGADRLATQPLGPRGPEQLLVCGRFPDDLRAKVRVGDRLRVACVVAGERLEPGAAADLRVVDRPALAADLARIDAELADATWSLREHFRAARLEKEGLASAALLEARAAAARDASDAAAWAVMMRALIAMDRGTSVLADAVRDHLFRQGPAPALCGEAGR